MAETMPLEMRALALEEPWSFVRGACSWKNVDIPTEVDSAAAAGELAWYKAAATWGGKPKSASWNDVPLFFFPDSAANKVEVKTKPAARVEDKSKAAQPTFFIEPAARVEGKTKPAAAISIEPAAKVEGKKAEPKVVAIVFEEVPDSAIQYLLKNPPRRPRSPPEGFFERHPELREITLARNVRMNKFADVKDDILKQYLDKQRAVFKIEVLDDGTTRFCAPEKSTA